MSVTIWGRANSLNVQKAMWACAEAGIEVERKDAGGAFGGLDRPEYLALNPNGRVPTLVDGELVLWESNAIVRYVAARYGREGVSPAEPAARALADQWIDWQQTTLSPATLPAFWGLVRTPEADRDWAAIRASGRQSASLFRLLDGALTGREYILGEAFTMADIPIGATARRWRELEIEHPELPALEAWYRRLAARPAFQTHIANIPLT